MPNQTAIFPESKKNLPDLRSGQIVRVHQKIREGEKERIQIFEGMVLKRHGGNSIGATATVRKIVQDIGVEKIFSLHSPNVVKIDILRQGKVRKSRIYYLRDLQGKSTRLKEIPLKGTAAIAAKKILKEEKEENVEEKIISTEEVAIPEDNTAEKIVDEVKEEAKK